MPDALPLALEALSRREHSAYELAEKLKNKACSEEDISAALAQCQRMGYQCDVRYVDAYCRMRIGKGDGPMKIEQFLRLKGIDLLIIRARLDEEPWELHAQKVLEKKFKSSAAVTMPEKIKQQRFMQSRGFSAALISDVFKNI